MLAFEPIRLLNELQLNMDIKTILNTERSVAHISVNSKKRVIENLAKLFAETVEELDEVEVFQSLITRERLGSTGIGSGIAIPHCRFPTNGETYGACLTLAEPVDFDSVDNQPVDIVFAMLVPEDAESTHLETLATLAEAFQQPTFIRMLRSAKTNEQLFTAITSKL